jgi:hypothetical protein
MSLNINLSLAELETRFMLIQNGPEIEMHPTSLELMFNTASTTSLRFIVRKHVVRGG